MTIETIKLEKRTDGERQAYLEGYNRGIADGRKRKEGRWILKNGVYYCSKCNNMALNYDDCSEGKLRTDFCPNCGAFMGV